MSHIDQPSPAALIVLDAAPLTTPSQPGAEAQAYAAQSRAPNTKRAYRADWEHFTTWCSDQGRAALPATPATVADYLAAHGATLAVATLTRRITAISQAHQLADYESPTKSETVRTVLKGIRRVRGSTQRQAAPAVIDVLRQMVKQIPAGTLGTRDRALLLVGFAGAFRRSELAALDIADVRFVPEGMLVTVRRSKTDQEGIGETKAIPLGSSAETCPVRTLKAWLKVAQLTEGPLFRPLNRHGGIKPKRMNAGDIATVVKRSAAAAGFDAEEFSGHSLRAGLATTAAAAGVADRDIKRQTGHKSDRVLQRYIRQGQAFHNNAAGKVGL